MGSICVKQGQNSSQQHSLSAKFLKKIQQKLRVNGANLKHIEDLKEPQIICLANIIKALEDQDLKSLIFQFVEQNQTKINAIMPPKIMHSGYVPRSASRAPRSVSRNQDSEYGKSQNIDEVFARSSINSRKTEQVDFIHKESYQKLRQKQQQLQNSLRRVDSTIPILKQVLQNTEEQLHMSASDYNRTESFASKSSRMQSQNKYRVKNLQVKTNNDLVKSKVNHPQKSQKLFQKTPYLTKKMSADLAGDIIQLPLMANFDQSLELQNINTYKALIQQYEDEKKTYLVQLQKLKLQIQTLSIKQHLKNQNSSFLTISDNNSTVPVDKQRIFSQQVRLNRTETQKRKKDERIPEYASRSLDQQEDFGNDNKHKISYKVAKDQRDHSKSLIIRIFRDSKIFPIYYSKDQFSNQSIQYRTSIEGIFQKFYGLSVYSSNPIEQTNLIYVYDKKQPKKYFDYVKDFSCWLLVGKVNQNLYMGAFINLKKSQAASTYESFLFSLPKDGEPYILKACKQIKNPCLKPEYINFGDFQFRIKTLEKKVHLNIDCLNHSFCQLNGDEPSLRNFSLSHGFEFELEAFQIHQIKFKNS